MAMGLILMIMAAQRSLAVALDSYGHVVVEFPLGQD
jgi:hypothetical protein